MIEILLVEDDPVLGRGLSVNLEVEGYRVHWARDLQSAHATTGKKNFDLLILDLGLPDGSGLEYLRHLRDSGSRVPVLILTAKTDEDSAVEGLQLGANDYIRKPFGDRELLARMKTALREPQRRVSEIRYGDLLIVLENRKAFHQNEEIDLSPREFDILTFMIQRADSVITREQILAAVSKDSDVFDRTIDSNISHLRSRLRKAGVKSIQINSVYGVGYRLEKA